MTQIGNWPYISWIVVPIPSDIQAHNLTYNWLFGLEYFQTNIQSTPYMSQSGQYPATAYVTSDYSNQDRIDVIDSIVSGVIPASVSSVRPLPYSWDYFNDETMSLEQITITEEQVLECASQWLVTHVQRPCSANDQYGAVEANTGYKHILG